MDLISKIQNILDRNAPVENAARRGLKAGQAEMPSPPKHQPEIVRLTDPLDTPPELRQSVRVPQKVNELDQLPFASTDTIGAVARLSGYTIPEELKAEIAALQARYEVAFQGMVDNTSDGARRLFDAQQEKLRLMAKEGRDVSGFDVWELEELQTECRKKMLAFKNEMRNLSSQAQQLVRPHLDDFAKAAVALADKLDRDHAELCSVLMLPEHRSFPALMVRKVAHQILKDADYPTAESPKTICSFIPN